MNKKSKFGLALASFLATSVALATIVQINGGGTSAITAPTARTNLGAAASGANTDITSITGLTGRVIAPEGDYTTSGYLFGESGNDTGITSPSDGVMVFYGNSAIGMKVDSNGPSEIRTVTYLWPNAQGAAGTILTNDGAGNLSWSVLSQPIAFSETFDPADASSNRNYLSTTIEPIADSTGSNINLFDMTIQNNTVYPVNGFWVQTLHSNVQGGAPTQDYQGLVSGNMNWGNGTDAMTLNNAYGWQSQLSVADSATVSNVSMLSYSTNVTTGGIVGNYRGTSDFSSFDSLDSFSGFELGVNANHLNNNYFGFTVNGNLGDSDGSIFGHGFTPTLGTFDGQIYPVNIGGNWTSFAGGAAINETPNITTQTNSYMGANFSPTIGTSSGYYVVNAGANITNVSGYNGFSHHPTIGTSSSNISAFDDGANVTTSTTDYNSVAVHPNIALLTSNFNGVSISPNVVGDGSGNAAGISINMGNVTNFGDGNVRAISANGDVSISGLFGSGLTLPLADNGGNPTPVNSMNANFTAAASSTTANIDRFGFGPVMSLQMGAGATATSGGFGLGLASLGMIDLLQLDTGASVDHITGSFVALVSPSGDGHIDNIVGYRTVPIRSSGTTTLDNFYAYKFDEPAGAWASTSWGVYSQPSDAENWFGGHVKVGGTAGSTDRVSDSGLALEVAGNTRTVGTATVDGTMSILEGGGSPSFHTTFQGGNQSGDITYTLPTAAPASSGDVLSATTGGVMSWTTITALTNPMTDLGDTLYGDTGGTPARLAGNTTTTKKLLSQTGDGVDSAAPIWDTLVAGDIPNLDASKITTGQLVTARGGTGVNSTATFPTSGTVVTEAATETLTNKTLGSTNTITGAVAASLTNGGNTVTLPNATSTLATLALTETLTNKTMGSTNTLTGATAGSFTNTGTVTLPTATTTLVGRTTADQGANRLITKDLDATSVRFVNNADTTKRIAFDTGTTTSGATTTLRTTASTDRALTFPDADDTIVALATTDTLTNKTISGSSNTLTVLAGSQLSGQVPTANGGTGANSTATFPTSGTVVTRAATETLSNKTLASPDVSTFMRFLAQGESRYADADNSNYVGFKAPDPISANVIWTLPAADGTSGQVLSTSGTGGGSVLSWVSAALVPAAGVVYSDGSTLLSEAQLSGTRGGTGVNSTATFPTSGTVVTEAATETLTNKTLGSTNTITGAVAASLTSGGNTITLPTSTSTLATRALAETLTNKTMGSTNTLTGATAGSFTSGGNTVTLPTATSTLATLALAETLTNKTISGSSNTLTVLAGSQLSGQVPTANGGTGVNSTATFPTSGTVVTEAATETLTNKTFDSTSTLTGATAASFTSSGTTITLPTSASTLATRALAETLTNKTMGSTNTLTGATAGSFTNTGTVTLPTATDTLVARATTDTLTNKTINGSSNTITNVSLTTGVTGTLPTGNGGTNKASWTTGSIPYLSSATQFAEDNSNLFWDGTNHRLGIGNASPATPLEVTGIGRFSGGIQAKASGAGSDTLSYFEDSIAYTPEFRASGTAITQGNLTYINTVGRAIKIGHLAWFSANVTVSAISGGSPTGSLQVTLPYPSANIDGNLLPTIACTSSKIIAASGTSGPLSCRVEANSSLCTLQFASVAAVTFSSDNTDASATQMVNGATFNKLIRCSGSYITAS